MYQYLEALAKLNRMFRFGVPAERQARQPFHMRPKSHASQHLVEDKIKLFGSPKQFWCYLDEDHIGFLKTIAAKTRHPHTLEKRMMEKLRILSGLRK